MIRRDMFLLALGAAASAVAGGSLPLRPTPAQTETGRDALAIMTADPRFRTWVTLVERSGLAPSVRGKTPFTVFTPTEAAFNRYPDVRERMLAKTAAAFPDTCEVVQFIRSHVLLGLHPVSKLRGDREALTSIVGTSIELISSEPVTVSWLSVVGLTGTATLGSAPLLASNAIIYPFNDTILMDLGATQR